MNVTLVRFWGDDKETLGFIKVCSLDGKLLTVHHSLELGWHNNQNDISCIPAGSYSCVYTHSPHLSQVAGHDVSTYELQNVPNRAGIRIHAANFYSELLGCLSLSNDFVDLNHDGELDGVSSRQAIAYFETILQKQPFTLKIIDCTHD